MAIPNIKDVITSTDIIMATDWTFSFTVLGENLKEPTEEEYAWMAISKYQKFKYILRKFGLYNAFKSNLFRFFHNWADKNNIDEELEFMQSNTVPMGRLLTFGFPWSQATVKEVNPLYQPNYNHSLWRLFSDQLCIQWRAYSHIDEDYLINKMNELEKDYEEQYGIPQN